MLLIIENIFVETLTTLATFYALYGDNIRVVSFDKSQDYVFYLITFCCFVLFSFELLGNSIAKANYISSFTFWMDLVSTLSLIFDIPWLSKAFFNISFDGNQVNFLKAGRVSRVTTRAARLVRFIRLIKLVKLGRLYKHAFEAINKRINKEIYVEEESN